MMSSNCVNTKYGNYSSYQISSVKKTLQKSIFYLLLYVDPQTKDQYPDIDVNEAFKSLQFRINGLNSILLEPPELVETMSYLEAAQQVFGDEPFDFKVYRKLVLDAGATIMKVKEVD